MTTIRPQALRPARRGAGLGPGVRAGVPKKRIVNKSKENIITNDKHIIINGVRAGVPKKIMIIKSKEKQINNNKHIIVNGVRAGVPKKRMIIKSKEK